MKVCTACKVEKTKADFYSKKNQKNGLRPVCKACDKQLYKKYYLANKEKLQANKRETRKKYYKNNKDKELALWRKRSLQKVKATPLWLSKSQERDIACKYSLASTLTKQSGQPWEVDHIIPLNGADVCGLHVPWNLRVITKSENRSKGNKYE